MGLESKILEIVESQITINVIEILLVSAGLKDVYDGEKTEFESLRELLDPEHKINIEKEPDLHRLMKQIKKPRKYEEEIARHLTRGEFYSYPDCCIYAFIKNRIPALRFYAKFFTKPKSYVLKNLHHAYAFHVPCKINCKETKKIAGGYRAYIFGNFPVIALLFEKEYLQERDSFLKNKHLMI